ncbi:S-methyl-5-thioribose-1-phosphate isomerase, partial [candidate division KSB1 bacterium]|nr:S-methyl-5-thioribose-1-phosphate isomerase [candidate division KSB1 bacterium]
MNDLPSISWHDGKVRILDQTRLPEELIMLEISEYAAIIRAINTMSIRGAPAIGIAAAFGVVLSVWGASESDRATFLEQANQAIERFRKTRPTAKNLFWALERMRNTLAQHLNRPLREIKTALLKEAQHILKDDIERCQKIGQIGAALLTKSCGVLTHCNAGALA